MTAEPNPHRDRVLALGSDIADLLKDLADRAKECRSARLAQEAAGGQMPRAAAPAPTPARLTRPVIPVSFIPLKIGD